MADSERVVRACRLAGVAVLCLLAACGRDPEPAQGAQAVQAPALGEGIVTISGDDRMAEALTWRPPAVGIADAAAARRRADAALAAGRLDADAESAIPIYLALLAQAPDDAAARDGLVRALRALLAQGEAALADAGEDAAALRRARDIGAVARTAGAGTANADVLAYLARVDLADRLWELNREAEAELRAGHYGDLAGDDARTDADTDEDEAADARSERVGALPLFRQALALRPGHPRAMQGIAALESALIAQGEQAARAGDFAQAEAWLQRAAGARPGSATIPDARERIAAIRHARIARLRDEGIAVLAQPGGLRQARGRLADLLAIAEPGDAAATELRERIDMTAHYGQFRPGQQFTDDLGKGLRGPRMVVVPHGGFRMGARDDEPGASDAERPQRYVRFDRGFAMSRSEVTVAQFARFVAATGYRTRAMRRGHSMAYDERGGNFVRRSGVDWRHDFAGDPAAEDAAVLHVSARDAAAYAQWLSVQSGQRYRLPSEAEFEYALRAGCTGAYPWGEGLPPARSGNFTGSGDRSAAGRTWGNAFQGYADGAWGPSPVARFKANAFGLHDLAGNVSEWVADCWHEGYRRAPTNGEAWINPGCRTGVLRGGSWASSPVQTRSAWRIKTDTDTTNARIGFRVVREL